MRPSGVVPQWNGFSSLQQHLKREMGRTDSESKFKKRKNRGLTKTGVDVSANLNQSWYAELNEMPESARSRCNRRDERAAHPSWGMEICRCSSGTWAPVGSWTFGCLSLPWRSNALLSSEWHLRWDYAQENLTCAWELQGGPERRADGHESLVYRKSVVVQKLWLDDR